MTFDDGKMAFEAKYKQDDELRFKIEARLAKLFGLWVAAELGLKDDKANAYAKDMVMAQLDEPGNDDIINKAEADLTAAGRQVVRQDLVAQVARLEIIAHEQVIAER